MDGNSLFSGLTNFVKGQADIANTRYWLLVNETAIRRDNIDLVNSRANVSTDRSKIRISFAGSSEGDIVLPQERMYLSLSCLLGNKSHFMDQCSVFKNENIDERTELIRKNK